MAKVYSLGVYVDGNLEFIKPSKLTTDTCENIFDIVKITTRYSSKEELISDLEDIVGKKITKVVYVVAENEMFKNYDILDETIKLSDARPYFSTKNERLLFSFKKNYFNKSFVTGLLALAMRKYDLDKDYKAMYKNLDIKDDEELVHLFYRGVRPNKKNHLPDIQMASNIFLDVKNSINAGVYNFDVERVKDFIVSFITCNAKGANASKNAFNLGSFLYKFDRSVAYDTNKDIVDTHTVDDEFINEEQIEVIETDFYPFYKKNEPSIGEEEYYSQTR